MTGLSESIQWLREAREERAERELELDVECEPGWTETLRCQCCGIRWGSADDRDEDTQWVGVQLDPRPERETMIRLHLRNCHCGSTFTAVREVMRAGPDGRYQVACDLCGADHEAVGEKQLGQRIICAGCRECPPTMRATA